MRLVDLEPRWCSDFGAPEGARQGIAFVCPCCAGKEGYRTRLGVWFDVPICGAPAVDIAKISAARMDCDHPEHQAELAEAHMGEIHWHVEGDSFDNLTLAPSIDASGFGHWHGYITNGAVN